MVEWFYKFCSYGETPKEGTVETRRKKAKLKLGKQVWHDEWHMQYKIKLNKDWEIKVESDKTAI